MWLKNLQLVNIILTLLVSKNSVTIALDTVGGLTQILKKCTFRLLFVSIQKKQYSQVKLRSN